MGSRSKAVLGLILASLMWSLGGVLIKLVNWSPVGIAGVRSAIAALVLWPFARRTRPSWSRAEIGGALAYAATLLLFVTATKTTTAANAIVLQYTSPIYVALFSNWFLGERILGVDWLATITVLGGMALFFFDQLSPTGLVGNCIGIVSGMTMAVMVMFFRKQRDGSVIWSVLLGNIVTAAAALPFVTRGLPHDLRSWGGLLILGVVQLGLPFVLYSYSIRHVTALEAILVSVLEPVLNPVWVMLCVGEVPGRWSLLGALLVLVTVTLRMLVVEGGLANKKGTALHT